MSLAPVVESRNSILDDSSVEEVLVSCAVQIKPLD
jgi:hypothetical protein